LCKKLLRPYHNANAHCETLRCGAKKTVGCTIIAHIVLQRAL
jgi:hypothetical protein